MRSSIVLAAVLLLAVSSFAQPALRTTATYPNATWTLYVPINSTTEGLIVTTPWNGTTLSSAAYNTAATAVYGVTLDQEGWDFLQVTTDASYYKGGTVSGTELGFYYAGYVEGFATQPRMTQLFAQQGTYTLTPEEQQWLDNHIAYIQNGTLVFGGTDPFWARVGCLLQQMQGLADGYSAAAAQAGLPGLTFYQIFKQNFAVEIGDVQQALNPETKVSAGSILRNQHCSALVKVTASDIYFSHDTWDGFAGTIRMYKIYQLDVTVAFSAMAGNIASGDDWYITSNNLAIMETTNGNYNNTLAALYVVPQTVSEFLRVMAATYLAADGATWVEYFQTQNSGTYCNQYMVLNYNLYTAGQTGDDLADGLLWVAEQIPGNVTSADVTEYLRNTSYWASFNVPYFKNIYDVTGFEQLYQESGDFFSYTKYARPEIFKRNQSQVVDLPSMQAIMRYNDFEHDPFSIITNCSAEKPCSPPYSPLLAIASRGDLVVADPVLPTNPSGEYLTAGAFGAVDCKITSSAMIANLQGLVISGPTTSGGILPVFSWTGQYASQRPDGAPLSYDFAWQGYNPLNPPHGWFSGLADTTKIVIIACASVGGVALISAVVVFALRRRQVHAEEEYAPLV